MYFKAIIDDGVTKISATRNIKDAMMAVTMICHSVYGINDYSESDRAVFRKFVEEELAKLAFADPAELVGEEERLKELCKNAKPDKKSPDKKSLKGILKALGDLLDKVEDEDEDE